jgi:hypothetical protein
MIHALEGVPFYNTVIQMMGHGWSISLHCHGHPSTRGWGLVTSGWAKAAFIEWKLRRIWNGVARASALAAAVASAAAEEMGRHFRPCSLGVLWEVSGSTLETSDHRGRWKSCNGWNGFWVAPAIY